MVGIIQLRYAAERAVIDAPKKGEYLDTTKMSEKDLARYGVIIEN